MLNLCSRGRTSNSNVLPHSRARWCLLILPRKLTRKTALSGGAGLPKKDER